MNLLRLSKVTLAISLLLLMSCDKTTEPNQEVTPDILSEVGKLHNEGLDYYYNNRTVLKSSNQAAFSNDVVSTISNMFVEKGYDKATIRNTQSQINDFISQYSLKSSSTENAYTNSDFIINQISGTNFYSPEMIKEIESIYALIAQNKSMEDVYNYINNQFAQKTFSNANDINGQKILIDVHNHSFAYWQSPSASLKSSAAQLKLKESSWVAINDGIGGVIGAAFGGVGAAIFGAYLSVMTIEGY